MVDPGSPPHRRSGRNDDQAAVFREPWEAEAFALAVTLRERGVFTAAEWAAALGDEIKKAQGRGDPDTGETYYRHWLAALERIVAEKGLTDVKSLARTRLAWERACARTPHGTPIELRAEDFGEPGQGSSSRTEANVENSSEPLRLE